MLDKDTVAIMKSVALVLAVELRTARITTPPLPLMRTVARLQWTVAGLSGAPGAAATVRGARPGSRPAPTQRHSMVERTARDQFLLRPRDATLTSVFGWLEETTLPMEMCLQ